MTHKTVRQLNALPLGGALPPTIQEGSGARTLAAPAETDDERVLDPALGGDDGATREALRAELTKVREVLAQRELEIAELKRRIASFEKRPIDMQPQTSAAYDMKPTLAATAPASQPAAEAPPPTAPAEPTYPTLQRVAVGYATNSSLPPTSSRESAPPSQRKASRRSCELELEFTEDSHFYAGLTQDISQGGVFIATYRLFPVGSRLELAFELPDGTRVKTRGEVRWLREGAAAGTRPGMGVAFSDLPEAALTAIADFCRERPPLYMDI